MNTTAVGPPREAIPIIVDEAEMTRRHIALLEAHRLGVLFFGGSCLAEDEAGPGGRLYAVLYKDRAYRLRASEVLPAVYFMALGVSQATADQLHYRLGLHTTPELAAPAGIPADTITLEEAHQLLPTPEQIDALAEALGLEGAAKDTWARLVTSTEMVGTPGVAAIFGFKDQSIRKWRRERREAVAAGRTLGPNEFIPHLVGTDEYAQYLAGLVYLWGMQTERLNLDGSVNTDRKLPGRAAGRQAPRVRPPAKDYGPQRQQVLDAYRKARRDHLDDNAARARVAEKLGLSRRVVARRLTEVIDNPTKYGPLWADQPAKPLKHAS